MPLRTDFKVVHGVIAVAVAAGVGAVVAGLMTFLDWRLNPGEIFHGDAGTSWAVVQETFLSWFGPVFAAAAAIALIVAWLLGRRGAHRSPNPSASD